MSNSLAKYPMMQKMTKPANKLVAMFPNDTINESLKCKKKQKIV